MGLTIKQWRHEIGKPIEAARQRAGLSKRKAAQLAGCSEGLWRQLESGARPIPGGDPVPGNPRPTTLISALSVVGLDVAEYMKIAGHGDVDIDNVVFPHRPLEISDLAARLDRVEERLDRVLAALQGVQINTRP